MDYKIELFPVAVKELEESATWYEKQSEGLGLRFVSTIYDSFDSIMLDPETYVIKKTPYREFVVEKFPFVIVYEIVKNDSKVYVLHVFHTSRNPKFKYRK